MAHASTRMQQLKDAQSRSESEKEWAWGHAHEVYHERDLLVRALSKIYPSHLMRHRGKSGNHKPVVCIDSPAGQLCWTLLGGDEQAMAQFRHLEWTDNDWDGHKTVDRYARLAAL